jgi:hypothetical protein
LILSGSYSNEAAKIGEESSMTKHKIYRQPVFKNINISGAPGYGGI